MTKTNKDEICNLNSTIAIKEIDKVFKKKEPEQGERVWGRIIVQQPPPLNQTLSQPPGQQPHAVWCTAGTPCYTGKVMSLGHSKDKNQQL